MPTNVSSRVVNRLLRQPRLHACAMVDADSELALRVRAVLVRDDALGEAPRDAVELLEAVAERCELWMASYFAASYTSGTFEMSNRPFLGW